MLERTELFPGVFFNALQTDKFKSDCLSVSLLTALDRDTISKNALLPRVLARGSARYPDMDAVNAACDELYGARVIPVVRKVGEMVTLGFYAGFLADRFTPDGSALLESVAALVGELLLHPASEGGALRADYVESEKEKLIEDIRGRVNDKRAYSAFRLIEQMFCYEAYGCDDMGTEGSVSEVDAQGLTAYYRSLLAASPVEIFYCGAADSARAAAAVRNALAELPRGELNWELGTDIRMNTVEARPRFFEETMEVGQGKLCLGFRLGDSMEDPDFAALRVFNALYGGTVTSKLFLNVREKLSLCYYASSALDRFKGALFVFSGIEAGNLELARGEILSQLRDVAEGRFTESELNSARKAVAGDLRSAADSPGALEHYYLAQTLLGLDYGPEEFAGMCEAVTAPQVAKIAAGAALDAVYFLHGETEDPEDWEDFDDAEA